MIKGGWPSWAIGGVAAAAVIGGLMLAGGPSQARKEHRDQQRESDLAAISAQVRCLANAAGQRLPEQLATTVDCPARLRLTDPLTDAPYRYRVTGARSYRVCADFELPESRPENLKSRDANGCIGRIYVPAPGSTPGQAATIPYRN